MEMISFGLCICTYKRPQLLDLLLKDTFCQSVVPNHYFIIDGDPEGHDVYNVLQNLKWPQKTKVIYLTSNHSNQTYQRYLGYRIALSHKIKFILYLDDDLRIMEKTSIESMLSPFLNPGLNAVATTGNLVFPTTNSDNKSVTINDLRKGISSKSPLYRIFGESSKFYPGALTPSGTRILINDHNNSCRKVDWLRGGAIAVKTECLSEKVLSSDFFAMNDRKMGICEDLVIGRKLLQYGNIYELSNGLFYHPNEDSPKAYTSKAFSFGIASSYSRRWLNDNYRGQQSPTINDRISLLRHYFFVSLLNWFRAIIYPNKERWFFAFGYSVGLTRGLLIKPTAKNLTPTIDWWGDAEKALSKIIVVK